MSRWPVEIAVYSRQLNDLSTPGNNYKIGSLTNLLLDPYLDYRTPVSTPRRSSFTPARLVCSLRCRRITIDRSRRVSPLAMD